jgi:hypothetical protein
MGKPNPVPGVEGQTLDVQVGGPRPVARTLFQLVLILAKCSSVACGHIIFGLLQYVGAGGPGDLPCY